MEQRVTLITLGVSDPARAKAFYEALGWRGQEVAVTVFFQAGGLGLVLWSRDELAADCGLEPPGPPAPGGFGGIALAHNVRSEAEADALLATVERAGGTITKPAAVNAVGFYQVHRQCSAVHGGGEADPVVVARSAAVSGRGSSRHGVPGRLPSGARERLRARG
ncbi:VOC family protein [Streptomyces fulvoviolaceus]|uniref:VOC family protein n=1 Tax=Streptomyces fulvoviolaceus TaxID=285535 RepID=UPI001F2AAA4B|nr:VOC family protein [Streptomyces fulvoviolaceus]MCT9082212.1 hypothetical protein [Streptomyces fulvoviolaceus]